MVSSRRFRPALCVLGIAGISLAAASSPPPVADLQPYRILSPAGTRVLEVQPSSRHGAGPSHATLEDTVTGEIIWKRKLPYTFWQACVNDDGIVGGFGYTTGPTGGTTWGGDPGDLFVRILDAEGISMHEEVTRRRAAFMYMPAPSAEALAYDRENDRMVILMGNHSFRSYHLAKGTLLNAVHMSCEGLPERNYALSNFHAVPHTSLLLLELVHQRTEENGAEVPGSLFALMDISGDLVWTVNHEWTLPEDWEEYSGCRVLRVGDVESPAVEADPFDSDPFAPGHEVEELEEIEDPFAPGKLADDTPPEPSPVTSFELYLDGNDHGERVTFGVFKVGEDDSHGWRVAEAKREQWSLPEDNHVPETIPRIEAEMLGGFRLLAPGNKPLSRLRAAALGPNGQIYAFELDTGIVHVFDRTGKPLHRCRPARDDQVEKYGCYGPPFTVSDAGEVFVQLEHMIRDEEGNYSRSPKAGHALHFSPDGLRQDKTLFLNRDACSQAWIAQPGGTNILVNGGPGDVELVARDPYRTRVASLTRRPDGNWLVDIADIAFAPDGSLAIRTSTASEEDYPTAFPVPPGFRPSEAISIYNRNGEPIRTIDFTDGASFNRIAFDGTRVVGARS
jgi:hypothetical protein